MAAKTDRFVRQPANISYQAAAVFSIVGITAWEALVVSGKVKKGDKVLIYAGAGGVGHIAIQFAKHLGATVIAISSAKNRDFILSLGAGQHIDYTTEKFYEVLSDYITAEKHSRTSERFLKKHGKQQVGCTNRCISNSCRRENQQQSENNHFTYS